MVARLQAAGIVLLIGFSAKSVYLLSKQTMKLEIVIVY